MHMGTDLLVMATETGCVEIRKSRECGMTKLSIQISELGAFVVLILCLGCTGNTKEEDEPNHITAIQTSDESFAQVRILGIRDEYTLIYRTGGEEQFQRSIQRPLSHAKPDPNPARYIILGDLLVHTAGKERQVVLFLPWGHIKIDEEYKIADLSELRDDLTIYMRELESNLLN